MSQKTGTLLFLLAFYGPLLCKCFRAKIETASVENRTTEDSSWCNPFSSLPLKVYYFDVRLSGEDCETGVCMGVKLIRDKEDPTLQIHHGRTWTVKKKPGSKKELEWKLKQWNPAVTPKDTELKLLDMHEIIYKDGDESAGKLDTLHIKWGNNEDLEIAGGLFYDTNIILSGLDKIKKEEGDQASVDELAEYAGGKGKDGARKDGIGLHGSKIGGGVGVGVGTVAVGGFLSAAVVAGTAISNTALAAAAMAGIVGGAAAGGIIGLAIGGGVALAGMAGLITLVHDKGLSASEKIWTKLWCINKFKTCYKGKKIDGQPTTLLVPNGKDCPQ